MRPLHIVESMPDLRDRNVATPCCIAAVAVVLGGGDDFPMGDDGGSGSRGIFFTCKPSQQRLYGIQGQDSDPVSPCIAPNGIRVLSQL